MTAEKELALMLMGAEKIVSAEELRTKLKRARGRGQPLRVKYGADPTAPDLHLGHVIPLQKLRLFQELGHKVIFIIGDFTARIGDPSGRSTTRPMLSPEDVERNARTYIEQVGRVLDLSRLEIRRNSEWLDPLGLDDLLRLCAKYTVARMIERDDFRRRLEEGKPIGVHEILYPLLQAYDSVVVEADVEVGGSDQLFNFIVGREIQRSYGQEPQVALTIPILPGTDGVQKMSKSLGNYIGISEPPLEMFGKVMGLSDELMRQYARLLLGTGEEGPEACPEEVSLKVFGISNEERRRLSRMLSGTGPQLKEAK
ncbi:MAG TPA: tyrosine--tRNA ligase, partial [Armatimonadetes bacterium]|nr:tyrosine--tRNA ligase [Armatimonadota bacterium]